MPPTMEKVRDLRGTLEQKRSELATIFEEAGPDIDMDQVKVIEGDSAAKVAKVRELNDEMDTLATELEPLEKELTDLERAKKRADDLGELEQHPGHPTGKGKGKDAPPQKSIGETFIESEAGTKRKGREVELPDVELKALFETGTGWAPESIRTGRLVDMVQRPIQVIDVIPGGSTNSSSIVYMEETTYTNTAAEVAEGGEKPEAALALTERSEPVRKIAVWLPVTDEQLEDVPQIQGYLNNRLPFMVRQRLDSQILVGDGTAPNLSGILDRVGIQTQAKAGDPTPDAVYKAMTKVRVVGRAIPSAYMAHPYDWQEVRLLRTADGIYIWGSPSEAGPERIWGLQVVQAEGLPEGTGLVGDFANFSELVMRKGMTVKVSDSHADYFIKNKQAIRAEIRAALAVYRPAAFCQVTGI